MNTTPTEQTIEDRVKTVISGHLGIEIQDILDSKTLEELGADSLDNVELAMGFEEEFNIVVDDDHIAATKLVSDAVGMVYELIEA